MARTRRQTPAENLAQWGAEYEQTTGVPALRSDTWQTTTPEQQEWGDLRSRVLGEHLPLFVASLEETHRRAAENPDSKESNQKNARRALANLQRPSFQRQIHSDYDTSIAAGGRQFNRLINGVIRTARSRTAFEEQNNPGSNVLYLPAGADFYPLHHGNYEYVGRENYGSSWDDDLETRFILAGTQFSAGSSPAEEMKGASALGAIHSHANDIGFRLTTDAADAINNAISSNVNKVRGSKKVMTDDYPVPVDPLKKGSYRLSEMEPLHQAIIVGHRGGAEALHNIVPKGGIDYGTTDWSEPASVIVGSLASTGTPALHKIMSTLRDPRALRGSSGGEQKVITYGMTTLASEPEHADVINHLVGAHIYGDRYWDQNPDAAASVAKHVGHIGMTNPYAVGDIHHARATSGLPPEVAFGLGDFIRPDKRLSIPENLHEYVPGARSKIPRGGNVTTAPHMAYLGMEHAASSAGNMSVHIPGFGRYTFAPHIRQALGWGAIQGAYPEGLKQIKSGQRSLILQDVRNNPAMSINPQVRPPIFRL